MLVSFWDHVGNILGLFWDKFGFIFESFLDTLREAEKSAIYPKTEPKWSPTWLQNRTFGRPAEHELDMLFIVFGPHWAAQGRSKMPTKIAQMAPKASKKASQESQKASQE